LIRLSVSDAAHRECERPEADILRHRICLPWAWAKYRRRAKVGAGTTAIHAVNE